MLGFLDEIIPVKNPISGQSCLLRAFISVAADLKINEGIMLENGKVGLAKEAKSAG